MKSSVVFVCVFLVAFALLSLTHKEPTLEQKAVELNADIERIPDVEIGSLNGRATKYIVAATPSRYVGSLELVIVIGEYDGMERPFQVVNASGRKLTEGMEVKVARVWLGVDPGGQKKDIIVIVE
jgi:hypothetical protein